MKTRFVFSLSALVFAILLVYSCKPGSSLVEPPPPFVELLEAPENLDTLFTDKVRFVWKGSESDVKFQYKMEFFDDSNNKREYLPWTNYDFATEVLFKNLDEGHYRFFIQGKSGTIEGGQLMREFWVDAVPGPSILFFKTETDVQLNAIDSIAIFSEDVDSLVALGVTVSFDQAYLEILGVDRGTYAELNFTQIILPEYTQPLLDEVNTNGSMNINTAFLSSNPQVTVINGSGELLKIKFRAKQRGTTQMEFFNIDMRHANGANIPAGTTKRAIVNVL